MPKLTKRFIDTRERYRTDREVFLWDDELAGFGVRLKPRPSRAAIYFIQYRNAEGDTRRLKIGSVGQGLTPDEAREAARAELGQAAKSRTPQGIKAGELDPSAARKAIAKDPTVAELCDLYLGPYGRAWLPSKKASTWATEKSNIERHIKPLIGGRKQRSLTAPDIEGFQRDVKEGKTKAVIKTKKRGKAIVEGGSAAAGRALAVLSTVLAFAVSRSPPLRPDNPALKVEREKQRKRERFLSNAELAKIGEAMMGLEGEGVNRTVIDALRLLLLTGCRRGEVTTLKWDHVDFDHGMLRLPDSKTGAREVPLGSAALQLLANLPRTKGIEWVFPASRGKGSTKGLPRIWKAVLKRAGVAGVRIHDVRHTFASVSVASGEAIYLTGKVLGHREARSTERYAHVARSPIQEVADRTSARIAAALKGGDTKNVVDMAKAKRQASA